MRTTATPARPWPLERAKMVSVAILYDATAMPDGTTHGYLRSIAKVGRFRITANRQNQITQKRGVLYDYRKFRLALLQVRRHPRGGGDPCNSPHLQRLGVVSARHRAGGASSTRRGHDVGGGRRVNTFAHRFY